MAPWIMLCLELIIDCIILVFSPHSFACSLYLYSFFASEKKKEIPRLYNGCFIFHIKIEPSFFLLFFFYMPTLVSHKKKKNRGKFHLIYCYVKSRLLFLSSLFPQEPSLDYVQVLQKCMPCWGTEGSCWKIRTLSTLYKIKFNVM